MIEHVWQTGSVATRQTFDPTAHISRGDVDIFSVNTRRSYIIKRAWIGGYRIANKAPYIMIYFIE